MTDYQQKTLDFLNSCNATIEIEFIGVEANQNWNDKKRRAKYHFTITTPRGEMSGDFWDSVTNTEIKLMDLNQYSIKHYRRKEEWLFMAERNKFTRELKEAKEKAMPTPYDILSCLEKYEVGTMNDFFDEFGYEVHSADDMFRFMNTYNAVVKEYHDLCRIFTAEQMEMLREIY